MVRTGVIVSTVLIALMLTLSVAGYIDLPADALVPVHWNFSGEVDRYAGRTEALLLAPGIGIGLTILLAVIPRFDPRRENLEKSRGLYLVAWIGVMLLMTGIHVFTLGTAITGVSPPLALVTILIGGFFAAIGSVLPRSRPNYFAGVRTPWTLSSDRSWTVTHLWTGRFFVATGVATILAGLLGSFTAGIVVLLAGILGSTVAAVIISYSAWKNDPDRHDGVGA